jgi:hypothetical protein
VKLSGFPSPRAPRSRAAFGPNSINRVFSGCSSRRELCQPFPKFLEEPFGLVAVLEPHHQVSSPGESHPEPLSEPYLNLSAHTAPAMEPRRTPICQCAHNFGSRLEIRATQCVALRK